MKLLAVFILTATGIHFIEAQRNYCSASLCPNGRRHIACGNSGAFSAQCTANARVVTLPAVVRNNIVRKHNNLRQRVASGRLNGFPSAVRMATMQWDNELASLAALNVKQCIMRHDACRNTNRFPRSGQNLAVTRFQGMTRTINQIAMRHIQVWFDEYRDTTYSTLSNYPANSPVMIGHFAQMVQERANRVGCAILRQRKNQRIEQYMACNYAYTLIYGQSVYRSGSAGSACTSGRNNNFASLCSTNEIYDYE